MGRLARRVTAVSVSALAVFATFALTAPTVGAVNGFGSPVVVSGLDAGEPGINVATDGTIYIDAPSGLFSTLPSSPSFVWRSDNGGSSWVLTPPGTRGTQPGGGDSDISIDSATGALYMTDLWLGNATVAVSSNKGSSWIANPLGGPPVQDRQWIATAGGGRVYHVTHQIPTGLVVAVSVDGGITYPQQYSAATPVDRTGCLCPPGTLIAEGGGLLGDKVGVIYSTSTGGVKFARSTNGAVTFAQATVSPASDADTVAAFPVVANAGGNKLVAVWLEVFGNPKSSRVRFASSANWGQSWSAAKTLVASGTSVYPWVDAKGSKVSVVLYHTADAASDPDSVPSSAAWYAKYLESVDGGTTFSAVINVDSTVVKTGPICTEGANCSANRQLLDFLAVALDGASRANVTWTRLISGNNTEIRFARQL